MRTRMLKIDSTVATTLSPSTFHHPASSHALEYYAALVRAFTDIVQEHCPSYFVDTPVARNDDAAHQLAIVCCISAPTIRRQSQRQAIRKCVECGVALEAGVATVFDRQQMTDRFFRVVSYLALIPLSEHLEAIKNDHASIIANPLTPCGV